MTFNEESCRVDEMTADLAKRDHLHAAALVAKAKELADCEGLLRLWSWSRGRNWMQIATRCNINCQQMESS